MLYTFQARRRETTIAERDVEEYQLDRFVALLLIPILAFGQPPVHVHAEDGSDGGKSRPHFHFWGHSQHDASQSDHETGLPPEDHDSDAVYLNDGSAFIHSTVIPEFSDDRCCSVCETSSPADPSQAVVSPAADPVLQGLRPPLYLLHAALRL